MKRQDAKPPVSVDVDLKAALEIRGEIPRASVGRTVDALVDIIRPFTERRGLKADQIRMQREDVALAIAKKARQRAELENIPLNPIPNKMLVPFFEKASLEELRSEMQERWAALLLSASTKYQSQHLTFIDVLGRLGAFEITILEEVCLSCRDFPSVTYPDNHFEENLYSITTHHGLLVAGTDAKVPDTKVAYKRFLEACDLRYGKILYATVARGELAAGSTLPLGGMRYYYLNYVDWYLGDSDDLRRHHEALDLLERERLVEIESKTFKDTGVVIGYFNVTPLGIRFVRDCSPDAAEKIARNDREEGR